MKVRAVGILLGLAVVGAMAMPATAEEPAGASVGVFNGQATVGKKGECRQDGTADVHGGGLGLTNASDPTQVLTNKLAWYKIEVAPLQVVDAVRGVGSLNLCGKLGPNATGLGASCATTKSWDGQGVAHFDPLGPPGDVYLSNVGWKVTAGGTFLVTGDVGGASKKKSEELVAVVQALDEEVVANCLEKSGPNHDAKTKTGGATVFNVQAAYSILPVDDGDVKKDEEGKGEPHDKKDDA